MGMRSSDARWLARDIRPFLEQLTGTYPADPGLRQRIEIQAFELLDQIRTRTNTEPDEQARSCLNRQGRNPTAEHYTADVDGHRVPHIDIIRWPCTWEGDYPHQEYPPFHYNNDQRVTVDWVGDWCWTVTVDDRFAFNFDSREIVDAVMPLLAQAMAVAAGFSSHGPHSFPANRHGPSIGLAAWDLNPGDTIPGIVADAVADRLHQPEPETVGQDDARMYAQNADYWRNRAETAERALAERGVGITVEPPPDLVI